MGIVYISYAFMRNNFFLFSFELLDLCFKHIMKGKSCLKLCVVLFFFFLIYWKHVQMLLPYANIFISNLWYPYGSFQSI